MMTLPTPGSRPRNTPTRHGRRMAALAAPLALLAFIAFEIGIRQILPDSMTYTETDDVGHVLFNYATNQPDLVNRWYAYANDERPVGMFAHCGHVLNEPPPIHRTYTFTWHGIPVESATSGSQGYFCYFYTLSAGGVPDPFDQYFLSNPHASPNPPPVGYQEIP